MIQGEHSTHGHRPRWTPAELAVLREVARAWGERRRAAHLSAWWARYRARRDYPELSAEELSALPEVAGADGELKAVLMGQGDEGRRGVDGGGGEG